MFSGWEKLRASGAGFMIACTSSTRQLNTPKKRNAAGTGSVEQVEGSNALLLLVSISPSYISLFIIVTLKLILNPILMRKKFQRGFLELISNAVNSTHGLSVTNSGK